MTVKESCLSAALVRTALEYEPSTGILRWRRKQGRAQAGAVAGVFNPHVNYIQVGVFGVKCYAHRLAWLITYGEWPKQVIDHIDGDTTNNKISNLRDVSYSVNGQNTKAARTAAALNSCPQES